MPVSPLVHINAPATLRTMAGAAEKEVADYSCRRLPGRPDEERPWILPNIHYTHFTPLT